MEIDVKLVITLGGMLVSVIGAAAVARQQIKVLIDQIQDQEQRMRAADVRSDQLENLVTVQSQRVDVLSKMNAPDVLAERNRELSKFETLIEILQAEVGQLRAMHNGEHK